MNAFRRLGLSVVTSVFSLLLVIFALFVSMYFVLDKPATIKQALQKSGVYKLVVDTTIARETATDSLLPADNPAIKQALDEAFPAAYIQSTSERNIDATYDWIHGQTATPQYQVDASQPKQAFIDSVGQKAEEKLAGLPTCSSMVDLTATPADALEATCRPKGVSTEALVSAAKEQAGKSVVLDQITHNTAELRDAKGQSLADRLHMVPEIYRYYRWSLYILPAIILLSAVAIINWSTTRRQGLVRIARILIVTGIVSIILSIAAVWLLSQAVRMVNNDTHGLVATQGALLEVARIIGAQLRNWWIGMGAGYIVLGALLLMLVRLRSNKNAEQNQRLNQSLGYNDSTPAAGTTFDPHDTERADRTPSATAKTKETGQSPVEQETKKHM